MFNRFVSLYLRPEVSISPNGLRIKCCRRRFW